MHDQFDHLADLTPFTARLVNLFILAVIAIVCAIADSRLEVEFFPLGAPWLFGDTLSDDNPKINGLVTWAFALLTYVHCTIMQKTLG